MLILVLHENNRWPLAVTGERRAEMGGGGHVITGGDVVVNDFTIGSRHALMMALSPPCILRGDIHIPHTHLDSEIHNSE